MTTETTRCIYCAATIEDNTTVPSARDDETWAELAKEHATGCEWITTRAHRTFSSPEQVVNR